LEVGIKCDKTHRLINICAKYFQNPLNYEEVIDRTQNIPYNRQCQSLTSKCDLGGRDHVLRLIYHLISVIFFKNPLMYEKVMDWTQNIP
jgi:hypothetical protein